MKFRITNTTILYVLVGISLVISIFALSNASNLISQPKSPNSSDLELRVSKLEFQQEYFRIVNNLLGFDQVNSALADNKEKASHCKDNSDLLLEWNDDIESLRNISSSFGSDKDVSKSMDTLDSLYREIQANCDKASS